MGEIGDRTRRYHDPARAPRLTRRAWIGGLGAGLAANLLGSGCRPWPGGPFAATDWPEALLADLPNLGFDWVRPAPGLDLLDLAASGLRADALIGGSLSAYRRLDRRIEGEPVVAARTDLGIACSDRLVESGPSMASSAVPRTLADLGSPAWAGRVALADPRDDPATRAVLLARLAVGPWDVAYAELVRLAAHARPIGRGVASALACLVRGEADAVPTASNRLAGLERITFAADPSLGRWIEGAAVLAGSSRLDDAHRLVEAIADRQRTEPPGFEAPPNPLAEALRVELLGSTLVEAQPELVAARLELRRSDRPEAERAAGWMVESPPWPPASIAILKGQPEGAGLLAALAEQIAPEPEGRAWLLDAWDRPARPIDDTTLNELASAEDGRLAREPRFRAWLRGEWTAWARQRYRRAARVAAGKVEAPPT